MLAEIVTHGEISMDNTIKLEHRSGQWQNPLSHFTSLMQLFDGPPSCMKTDKSSANQPHSLSAMEEAILPEKSLSGPLEEQFSSDASSCDEPPLDQFLGIVPSDDSFSFKPTDSHEYVLGFTGFMGPHALSSESLDYGSASLDCSTLSAETETDDFDVSGGVESPSSNHSLLLTDIARHEPFMAMETMFEPSSDSSSKIQTHKGHLGQRAIHEDASGYKPGSMLSDGERDTASSLADDRATATSIIVPNFTASLHLSHPLAGAHVRPPPPLVQKASRDLPVYPASIPHTTDVNNNLVGRFDHFSTLPDINFGSFVYDEVRKTVVAEGYDIFTTCGRLANISSLDIPRPANKRPQMSETKETHHDHTQSSSKPAKIWPASVPVRKKDHCLPSAWTPIVNQSSTSGLDIIQPTNSSPNPVTSGAVQKGAHRSKSNKKGKGKLLNELAVRIMNLWYERNQKHPYPNLETCQFLAEQGGITGEQVQKWFANKRQRNGNTCPKKTLAQIRKNLRHNITT